VLELVLDFFRALWAVLRGRTRRGPLRPGWSFATELNQAFVRRMLMGSLTRGIPWLRAAEARAPRLDRVLRSVRFTPVDAGGVRAVWCRPASGRESDRIVLYLHGGGYVIGSPEGHRELLAHLAVQAEARVLAVDYRLGPENVFPAAQEDCIASYRWLLAQGNDPSRLAVAGDSAGGALALAVLQQARNAGDPLPAAAALLCPWVDPLARGGSLEENAECDFGTRELLVSWIDAYMGASDAANPLVSPIHADLAGLPPLLVQWGGAEILRDQVRAFVERARAAGLDVSAHEWPHMFHDWMLFHATVPEAAGATHQLGEFLRRRVKGGLA